MLTPIILLVLMTAPYLISRVLKAVMQREVDLPGAGAIGLTLLFILTGIGHFTETEAMAQMLPSWVPRRTAIIYLTGVLEFAIAAGFFFRKTRPMTGCDSSRSHGRSRLGSGISADSRPAAAHHPGLGLLVYDQDTASSRLLRRRLLLAALNRIATRVTRLEYWNTGVVERSSTD